MELQVLQDYECRNVRYRAGQLITVTDSEALALLADSPGTFALVQIEADEPQVVEKNRAGRARVKK